MLFHLVRDAIRFLLLGTRSSVALKAENLFLRKQLALYVERTAKARRATDATRLTLALLSKLFAWKEALVIVKPETLIRWHRKGFQLFWRMKSRPRGRPRIPADLRQLIVEMAQSNPTWGEERIAAELLLKLGIRVSPRTVRRYLPDDWGSRKTIPSQRWMTFVRNHAQAIVACDFFRLHQILQVVMGWEDKHLHRFALERRRVGKRHESFAAQAHDEHRPTLRLIVGMQQTKFLYYEYDFGDGWVHELDVAKILPPQAGMDYPMCTGGARRCPPEDCGGPNGYQELLKVLRDSQHPDHTERLKWVGQRFDPEAFDLEEVNQELRYLRPEL